MEHLRGVELVDARLHRAVGIVLDVYKALRPYLRTLDEVGELVELLARVRGASGHANSTDVLGRVEHRERPCLQNVHQFDKLHAETQVGLVATEAAHGLVPRHLLQLRQLNAAYLTEQMASHFLKQVYHVVLVDEAHLAVYLGELGLAVGPQVLVAEALGYLEVTVEAAHHEQLLKRLRALRQGVELPGVHA